MALNYKIGCGLRFQSASIMPLVTRAYEIWLESGKSLESQGVQFSAKVRRILADLLGNLKDGLGHTEGRTTIITMDNETIYWADEEALEAFFEEMDHIFNLQSIALNCARHWELFSLLNEEAVKIPKFSITW